MNLIVLIITLLLNGGGLTAQHEDDPIVPVMADVAIAMLAEAHPECASFQHWAFNADDSGGIQVLGLADCEYAGEWYRNPETRQWSFAIEGS